jgi:putative copper resistance protein D
MFEAAVVVLRLVQMTGAMILFGSSLFFLYGLPGSGEASAAALRWPRPLLTWSAAIVLGACVLGLIAQTTVLAGSLDDAMKADSLGAVLSGMSFGKSSIVRAAATGGILVVLMAVKPSRGLWMATVVAGTVICASFAWMGHGAATHGAIGVLHTASDIAHALAAGLWIGALAAFLILLLPGQARSAAVQDALHRALHGFSGLGSALVAVLVATGLINGAFVVGWPGLQHLWTSPYGQLLTAKLVLFVGMLGMAAANRFRLTPTLGAALVGGSTTEALAALRRSVALETALALAVLALVAWFGTLAPRSAL